MTDKLKQTIKEEMVKLPKESQEAINSLDWGIICEQVGQKYLLSDSEINDLQVQTLLVLIGLRDEDSFLKGVENEIGISEKEALKIAGEMDEKVFTPIANKITENIKKGGKIKNSKPEQTLDFILSGGDYSSFMEKREEETLARPADTQTAGIPKKPIKIEDIKSKFTI